MKKTRKSLVIAVILTMLFSMMGLSAMAAGSHTITINSETSGHTYQAYQVFAGTYSEDNGVKTLTNVTWGSGVNGANLLAALKANATYGSYFTSCTTAAQVADAITGIADTAFPDAFAKIVAQYLTSTHTDSGTPTGSYVYTITGLADGYYFINEVLPGGTVDNAFTKYILQVLGDVTINAKTDKPAIAKKVLENNDSDYKDTWNDAADYNIGDDVPFRDVALVPDMSNYETYYYQITDTISDGLDLNSGTIKVYYVSEDDMYDVETSTTTGAGGTELTTGFTIVETSTGFTVTFDDLKTVSGVTSGGYIVVEYTATLTEDAVIGNPGNPSEVYLTYSNNPNDNTGLGQTPKDEVVVYTFNLPVEKVDDEDTALLGATFALFTDETAANTAASDPTESDNFASALTFMGTAGSYIKSSETGSTYTLTSDANAEYALQGLDQGTYYLVEITEPTGYNRLSGPVTVTIAPDYNDGSLGSAYVNGHIPDATNDQLNSVAINSGSVLTVINNPGVILPGTGGIGTVIFTAGGLLLMIAIAVLFVTKRKVRYGNER